MICQQRALQASVVFVSGGLVVGLTRSVFKELRDDLRLLPHVDNFAP